MLVVLLQTSVVCVPGVCEQDGRCVRVCVTARRPRCPSCTLAGCMVFVLTCCGATSTGLWCRVWPVCTAASGGATNGAALGRETAAATRSDQRPPKEASSGPVSVLHLGSSFLNAPHILFYSLTKIKDWRNCYKTKHET